MARILLVEDEMLVRELALEDLTEAGHDVVSASDGDEALAIVESDRGFDLLFTDIKMPSSIDGRELAAQAKQLIPQLKVIYATGLADAGITDAEQRCLQKPYRREALLELVAALGLSA